MKLINCIFINKYGIFNLYLTEKSIVSFVFY